MIDRFPLFHPWLLAAIAACLCFSQAALADEAKASIPGVVDRVRYFPASGREQAMVGGKITGSNVSARDEFETLTEITSTPPAGHWNELTFPNTKLYRWIRYEAPAGSY